MKLFRNKRTLVQVSVVVVIALLTLLLVHYFTRNSDNPEYIWHTVERGSIENVIAASGSLEPKDYVEVGAQVSGQLESLAVDVGDVVKRGQLLAEIDATVFETNVMSAEASLENKRAQLEKLYAEQHLAEERLERNRNLFAQNAISQDTLTASETDVKGLTADIRAMQAQIKADSASLDGDKATLNYAKIYAPMDGTVVSIAVREGQTLNANQSAPLIMKIADLSVLTLRTEVSEADVTQIYAGMPVYFSTLGAPDKRWYSTVRQVLPTPEVVNDVVLYQVLIDIENKGSRLMDSMTAQVFFIEAQAEDVLTIPTGALRRGPKGPSVIKQTAEGSERVAVKLGMRTRTQVAVTSGLSEGDKVVAGIRNPDSSATSNIDRRAGNTMGGPPPGGGGGGGGRRGGF
ncbi:efflux RND transporter periplasmic adaptor subunit [Gilvimarinus agarilyticus]|uniref:efflux RND transporter periplasmic adaptor subunit n=1 Tax=unclassified Gilvimarinus TaxID=2642066 RepID=UPI001C08464B|nr:MULTISPECIES: efflux RND transporter periplasmic adaptor subunit [unclassified Gilvimarinus]MBU2886307.1 efflux RND transporter periplasmic adaptor subunit [Gilvimarinus agarilyticus]MDO6570993.1 efflux RND transporter periplasmic adaptor subunit [Gilvimarinus sp. 2_MG-2023]MDO6747848.1 efflux RND transporter periplasmic adaptor subunit [Gilvimarinus sp. 1_MG-2023]